MPLGASLPTPALRQTKEAGLFERLTLSLAAGVLLEETGRQAKAIALLERISAGTSQSIPGVPDDRVEHLNACTLLCCAIAGHRILRVSDTRRYADRALNLATKLRCKRMRAEALVYSGLAYLDGRQLGAARQALEEAIRVAREAGVQREIAAAKDALGQVDAARGELYRALANFSEALVLFDEVGDSDGRAMVLRHTGSAYLTMSDASRALTFHQQSLRLAEQTKDIRSQLIAHGNICRAHIQEGNTDLARRALTESMRLDLHVKNEIAAAYMNLLQAELSCAATEYAAAHDHAEVAQRIFAEHGDHYHTALARVQWGIADAGMKNFGGAREQFDQGVRLLRELGANADLSQALLSEGRMHIIRDDIPAAVECLLGAMEVAEEVHLHGLAEQCKEIIERVPAERWARVLSDLSTRHRELMRLSQFREDMAHHLTHDLRSPVANIRTTIDGVLGDDLSDMARKFLTEASASCSILLSRITTILDVYQMERTEVPLRLDVLNIGQAIEAAWGLVGASAPPDLSFAMAVDPLVPEMTADPEKIQRVLENLLANAVKYAGRGLGQGGEPPRIVAGADFDPETQTILVYVQDNGPGVPEDVRDLIFERFGVVGGPYQRPGSLGLGLHFAKIVVDAHGGRIWADSGPGKGSRFAFELPMA